jgi:ATP-dependent protease ClpP protease subunit
MYLCKKTICSGVWRSVGVVIVVAKAEERALSRNATTSNQGIVGLLLLL